MIFGSLILMSCNILHAQSSANVFGKYLQQTEGKVFFKGEIVLASDSIFSYRSLGLIKDSAAGKFSLVHDTIFFKYSNGFTQYRIKELEAKVKPFPIEMFGPRLQVSGRPFRLLWDRKKEKLFVITEDNLKNGFYRRMK